jgi:hypothetical protein
MFVALVAVASFVAGFVSGVGVTPHLPAPVTRRVSRMRHAVWQALKDHLVVVMVVGFLVLGAAYGYGQWRQDQTQACLKDYLDGTVPKAQAVTDATQKVFNDVAGFQTADTPAKQAAAGIKFYADLAKEETAANTLSGYRTSHAPRTCP